MISRTSILTIVVLVIATFGTTSMAHDPGSSGGHMMNTPGHMHNNRVSGMGHSSMAGQMMYHGNGHHAGHGMGTGASMQSGMPGGGYGIKAAREMDAEAVRKVLTGLLAWTGNPRLKVGKVEEKDDDTVTAEIVTLDGSLVDRLAVNRHTGAMLRLP